jgi:hypothetical protein
MTQSPTHPPTHITPPTTPVPPHHTAPKQRIQSDGAVAAARHVLDRGNEILKDFANRPTEEFRLAMAYQKFGERASQMRDVLRRVLPFPDVVSGGAASAAVAGFCGEPPAFQHTAGPVDPPRPAEGSSQTLASAAAAATLTSGAIAHLPTVPMTVLSLGGGSGNDAVGAVAYLLERNSVLGGVCACPVAIPSPTPGPPPKLTYAEKQARKKAGNPIPKLANAVDFRFAHDICRERGVECPAAAPFPPCPGVRCHVLDIDAAEWFASAGAPVQHALRPPDMSTQFADMHWHGCDVTEPTQPSYPPVDGAAGAPTQASGASLIVSSYLFTIHMGLPAGHTARLLGESPVAKVAGELDVSSAFWGDLIVKNPQAWFVFVEGSVSKKTWSALFENFVAAGRVLMPPTKVTGELPQRAVIPSKRRPHPIRQKSRAYCYWFSPPLSSACTASAVHGDAPELNPTPSEP